MPMFFSSNIKSAHSFPKSKLFKLLMYAKYKAAAATRREKKVKKSMATFTQQRYSEF